MRIDIHIFINYMTVRIGIKMLKCLPWSSFTQFSCLTVAKCMITLLVKPNVPSSWIVKDERDFSREEILHITLVEWCMICNGLLDFITVWCQMVRKLDRRYAWNKISWKSKLNMLWIIIFHPEYCKFVENITNIKLCSIQII